MRREALDDTAMKVGRLLAAKHCIQDARAIFQAVQAGDLERSASEILKRIDAAMWRTQRSDG